MTGPSGFSAQYARDPEAQAILDAMRKSGDVSVANSHSGGGWQFEKATTMLFPSEIA